jgi:ElaB/YqjD/DUF883 family membrane-anchored ribosome-binding protein
MISTTDKKKNSEVIERMLDEFNEKIHELEEFIKTWEKDSTHKYDPIIKEINDEINCKKERLFIEKEVFKNSGNSIVKDIDRSLDKAVKDLGEAIKNAMHKLKYKS